MIRFSRPGTTLERFLIRPLRPSDTHCSTLIGFIGMVFGSKRNFSSTGVFVNPAASKRFAKTVYIRLRGCIIRYTGNAVFRAHCPHEDQAAPPPLSELTDEVMGDV